MQVYIVDTDYQDLSNIQDVPSVPFLNSRNPIYIGVKEQQVSRVHKAIARDKLGGTAMGFWEIITKKGKVNWDVFKDHDVVFLASPTRAHEQFRTMYLELVDHIKSKL